MRFADIKDKKSPVEHNKQFFVWHGEYKDGSSITEFDLDDATQSRFEDIEKANLKYFGLVGAGHEFRVDNAFGTFHIAGRRVDFIFDCEGYKTPLTLVKGDYSDVIAFKEAHAYCNVSKGKTENLGQEIVAYYFGFKKKYDELNARIMCHIPLGGQLGFKIRLVSKSKVGQGYLKILVDGVEKDSIELSLNANEGKEITWRYY